MPPKGSKHTPEARAAISAALKGKGNGRNGRKDTEETREKKRASQTGKRWTLSEEARANISAGHKGKNPHTWTAESRQKLSDAKKGKPSHMKGKTHTPETRAKLSETLRGKCGPLARNWRGGTSFEPYCVKFTKEFKERVRDFFGRTCVECGAPENGKKLAVHHVNYHKGACCTEDVIPLFVPLCNSCHGKTQGNREYWEARFTALINEQYGGRCYLPKDDPGVPPSVT